MGIISILIYCMYTSLWEYYVYTHIVSFKWSLISEIYVGDIIWESECLSEGNVVDRTINPER